MSSASSLRRRHPVATDNDRTDSDAYTAGGGRSTERHDVAEEEEDFQRTSVRDPHQHDDYSYPSSSTSLADMDRSMHRAAIVTLMGWIMLVAFSYGSVAYESLEKLQGAEQLSALAAFLFLTCSLLAKIVPLVLRKAIPIFRGDFFSTETAVPQSSHFSGILMGGITTQFVAISTDAMMAFGRVPVLIDPVLHKRVSVLRWAEFAALAFLMTFLTEAFAVHDTTQHRRLALYIPMLHSICQGVATLGGMFFPYCPGEKSWYTLLLISCCCFLVIFPRLSQKQKAFAKMKPGRTLDEAIVYDRARLSLRMLRACTFCWTLFPMVFFLSGYILPSIAPSSSFLRSPALPMVFEAMLDVLSKLVQMDVIMDVHNGVFDDQDSVRALQKLEEVKESIGDKWATANDVVVISVRQEFSGTVASMVSPSLYDLNRGQTDDEHQQLEDESLVFSLGREKFAGNTADLPTNHSVRPSILMGRAGANNNTKRLSALAGLVVRAWNARVFPRATLSHAIDNIGIAQLCDAEITRLEENLLVVVVRGCAAD